MYVFDYFSLSTDIPCSPHVSAIASMVFNAIVLYVQMENQCTYIMCTLAKVHSTVIYIRTCKHAYIYVYVRICKQGASPTYINTPYPPVKFYCYNYIPSY